MPDLATRPAHLWVPECSTTYGDIAAGIGRLVGLDPDPEQEMILDAIFAEQSPGTPSCFEIGVVAPRQNLKTAVLQIAALTDLFVFDAELTVWTAHLFPTARKSFEQMCQLIDNTPDLKRRCRPHRTANGSETIERKSGQKIEFHARSKGGGRGFTGDKVILDEALYLTDPMLGALLPTMATIEGAQVRYASSAGLRESATLREIRDRGRAGGDPSLAWFEWCAERRGCAELDCSHAVGTDGCAYDDEELWAQANPALGRRISLARLRKFRRAMPADEWAREFLGWWDDPPHAGDGAISPLTWASMVGSTPPRGDRVVFALDVAPDHSTATIAASWQLPDGSKWLQLADHRPGVEWVPERIDDLLASWGGRLVVEQTGTAAFLLPSLPTATETVSRRFYADSCSTLDADVTAMRVRHGNQPELNAAVSVARWSVSAATGQRVLSRKDSRVSPLVAAALALHALVAVPAGGGWMVGI